MNLFVFGIGYTAGHYLRHHAGHFDTVSGTVRSDAKVADLADDRIKAYRFDPPAADPAIDQALAEADALLVSAQPGPDGDPALHGFGPAIANAPRLRRIVYLSTIGVYGDHGGAWIDEEVRPVPASERGRYRLAVEDQWLALGAHSGRQVAVLRLAGIYGPGRNVIEDLRDGSARRIVKPGQVFNRIHVDDIATTLLASIDRPRAGAIYNVTDDEPAAPQTVTEHAAALTGLPLPPEIDFETADLSPMARSFYGENKRVRNRRIRDELGVELAYPTYREGLAALKDQP